MKATTLDSIQTMPYGYWALPSGEVIPLQNYAGHGDVLEQLSIDSYADAYDAGMVRVVNLAKGSFQGFSFRGRIVSRETVDTMIGIIRKHFLPANDAEIEIFWQDREDSRATPKKFRDDSAAISFLRSFYR